uniref:Uncharacterized protein n=1 Tax=Anguilla anguilla TaxID=7936 RepID=A0A0E9V3S4_ANGAN
MGLHFSKEAGARNERQDHSRLSARR